ncbi:CPBP family intramembrane metalloprotease [Clostridium gasigenes]|uniref:CPBP family intramembrane glutamic endopeptidase n=1 Tax=Clostridium gasigenes TaxID=94869 RepID=UPI001438492F|nr:CPBP family intramembrane glutamic endopeptidase [Clostridium gasigenes]NKF08317.1 CPBP family intramembrane metalloprotease [Clostridium gasigenes]QSW20820.1 CPBP family intramembrane metalloprotease [Clostridium gasigenes]
MNLIKKSSIHKLSVGEIGIEEIGFWKAIGIIIIFQIVAGILGIIPNLIETSIYGEVINRFTWFRALVNDLVIQFIGVIIIIKMMKAKDDNSRYNSIAIGITKKDYIYCAGLIVSFIMIKYGILNEILEILESSVPSESLKELNELINNSSWILLFVEIVIIAPVFEEIIFRGIILNGMLKKYSPKKAIIVSSLIFGLIHGNLPQGLNAFVLGLVIATVYYYTRSLYISMFMHAANNFLVFFIIVPENFILKIALYVIIPVLGIALLLKCRKALDLKNRFNGCVREEEISLIMDTKDGN